MPSDDLFRAEALQAQQTRWLGEIHIATPPRRWIVVSVALLFTAAIVAYLFLGEYTRRETVPGTLVPAAGLLNLDALQAGVVRQMFAHVGQVVRVGQPLLEIDGSPASAGLGSAAAVEIAQLRAEQLKLQGDLLDQQGLALSQRDALRSHIAALDAQVVQVSGQIALERQSVLSLSTLLAKIQPLGKEGYVSALEIQQQQLAALNARSQLSSLRGQRAALQSQRSDAQQQLAQVPLQAATQRHATQNQLAQLQSTLAQVEAQARQVLRAPRAGIVSALVIKPGMSVSAGETLLSIEPRHSQLVAQLLVPSSAIGFIHPHEPVLLRYQAFPYQQFGLRHGTVTEVSRSALDPTEAAALLGEPVKASFYRVLVALHRQTVRAYGRWRALKPGMALTANVMLDKRPLIDWIFQPLLGMKQRMDAEGKA
ncbi:HlyD family efflux transporter periplasmic adaptor subunit [Metallibacterium sp.]|uniref:HlyD family secretion protein n=1 Tax=Metallibacterium sp. TaxID=2940281 RepID=UPI00260A440E|nr:HlyD family efflux transporter periplasmic adaptor subunit [Metallibacterium sp.]